MCCRGPPGPWTLEAGPRPVSALVRTTPGTRQCMLRLAAVMEQLRGAYVRPLGRRAQHLAIAALARLALCSQCFMQRRLAQPGEVRR